MIYSKRQLKDYLQHCITECGGHNIVLGEGEELVLPQEFSGEGNDGPRPAGNNLGELERYWCKWHTKNCDILCI